MRKRGARNRDFEASRREIVERVATFVVEQRGPHSFRALAGAAGLNPTAVRHYFGDSHTLVSEALRFLHARAEPMLRRAAEEVPTDLGVACETFATSVVYGWRAGLGAIHHLGMTYALTAEGFGPTYLSSVLEPTLLAAEARFAQLVKVGAMKPTDLRAAALSLVAPIVLALMHQDSFGGNVARPLDALAYARWHANTLAAGLRADQATR